MDVVFAAVGGPDLTADILEDGLCAVGTRGQLDEIDEDAAGIAPALRVRGPWTGNASAWCEVEPIGADSLANLLDMARAIAQHTARPVRAIASVIERTLESGGVEIGYRAYDLHPDGSARPIVFEKANAACHEISDDPSDELIALLWMLVDDIPVTPCQSEAQVRCFRRRPRLDDPRLAQLATNIVHATHVSFEPIVGERVRIRIQEADGSRRIALVSDEEAYALRAMVSASS